jgi:hypothetical protein
MLQGKRVRRRQVDVVPQLRFNFERIDKKRIMELLIDIYERGGIDNNRKEMFRWLSHFTNLGNEQTLHALYYYHQKQKLGR